jgi:hypothetical protein
MSKPEEVCNRSSLAVSEDLAKGMPSARTDENEVILQKNGFAPKAYLWCKGLLY